MDEILKKVELARASDGIKTMTVSDKIVKLIEEVGEISAAHLMQLELKPRAAGSTMQIVRNNKKEEYADALLVIFDLILADGFTFEEMKEELNKGVNKWYEKY